MAGQRKLSKNAWKWAFYDWANSGFATTVMAGFFPIFFKSFWAGDLEAAESTFVIGSVNSLIGLLIAISAPILGAIADAGKTKKKLEKVLPTPLAKQISKKVGKATEKITSTAIDLWNKLKG